MHLVDANSQNETAATLLRLAGELSAELHPRRAAVQSITLDASLDRDLGLDSLARVELLTRVERRFGVALPERVYATAETPRDLLRAVETARGVHLPAAVEVAPLVLGEETATPQTAATLTEVLDWHVRHHHDRPHIQVLVDEGATQVITFGQLQHGAKAVAAGLQALGLQTAEPVAIMLPSGRDYFVSFFGVMLAGGIPVPLYPPARMAQLEDHLRRQRGILSNCLAATLIAFPEVRPFTRLLKSQTESLRHIVTAEELGAMGETLRAPRLNAGDIALLQYTSGSTGNPKGVVLSHANLLANIRAMGETVQAGSTDVFVSWLPLYHDMGLIGAWLGSLYYAMLLVIMSPLSFITRPARWLWAIHRHKGTLSAAPNFAFELCLRRLNGQDLAGLDLSSWRLVFNGAEPVSALTVERFCRRFEPHGFRRQTMTPVYGLAESSVGLAFPPLYRGPLVDRVQRETFLRSRRAVPADSADTMALNFVACGEPLPGHYIRVVDEAQREVPERQEGRLQFRGPSATSGYYRNPDATRLLFSDAWLDSGDLAYIAGGDVYITGRLKDLIIHAGRNISPNELEEAVGDITGIRKGNVAVFGGTDSESGTERLVVMAETRESDDQALAGLRNAVNAVAVDLIGAPPDDVLLVPPHTVLKTSSGKVRRAASRELYERGRMGEPGKALWLQVVRLHLAGLVPQLHRVRRRVAAVAYAAYAWTLYGLMTPVVWTGVVVLPRPWRWRFVRSAAHLLSRLAATPLTVQGLENLPTGPCVFAANHASYLDSYALIAVLPRPVSFVAKGELASIWPIRLFLRRIDTEFVERYNKTRGVEDARNLINAARADKTLLFYPEGTFTRTPGLLPFHMGAFITAAAAGLPVVPVVIRGTRSMLRSDSWFPRRGAITITIGCAVMPGPVDMAAAEDPWPAALRLRDTVRERILRHCGEPDLERNHVPL